MKPKFSSLISDLVETWLLWVSNNDKCRDKSLSYSDRRQCVNNCENLIKKGVDFVNPPCSNEKVKVAFCIDPNDVYLELVEEL